MEGRFFYGFICNWFTYFLSFIQSKVRYFVQMFCIARRSTSIFICFMNEKYFPFCNSKEFDPLDTFFFEYREMFLIGFIYHWLLTCSLLFFHIVTGWRFFKPYRLDGFPAFKKSLCDAVPSVHDKP